MPQKKEQFSVAYIRAIAAQVGINVVRAEVDNDSVDMELCGKSYQTIISKDDLPLEIESNENKNLVLKVSESLKEKVKFRNPHIQFQLKCSSQEDLFEKEQEDIDFPLPKKNYIDLRGEDVIFPRYLIVVHVPKNDDEWIAYNSEGSQMALKHCAYWMSIRKFKEVKNKKSKTINIPKSQIFNSRSLSLLMYLTSRGIFI